MIRGRVWCALIVWAAAACQAEPTDPASLEAREAMRFSLATRFRVSPEQVRTESFTQRIWSDDCLGIPQERECRPGTFFGYRLQATIDQKSYAYHARVEDPFMVLLAEGPDPGIGLPALAWEWIGNETGCQSLLIAPDGLAAVGLCGGPHAAHALLEEVDRPAEWQYFHRRFAPFDFTEGDHALGFYGPGADTATLAWQRAITAWAALQWTEIQGGRSGAAYGRALAARRPISERPGVCTHLEVTEYGRGLVSVGACQDGAGELSRDGWLQNAEWEQLSGWFHEWAPVYDGESGIEFYARGSAAVGGVEKAMLLQLADAIAARLLGG